MKLAKCATSAQAAETTCMAKKSLDMHIRQSEQCHAANPGTSVQLTVPEAGWIDLVSFTVTCSNPKDCMLVGTENSGMYGFPPTNSVHMWIIQGSVYCTPYKIVQFVCPKDPLYKGS